MPLGVIQPPWLLKGSGLFIMRFQSEWYVLVRLLISIFIRLHNNQITNIFRMHIDSKVNKVTKIRLKIDNINILNTFSELHL